VLALPRVFSKMLRKFCVILIGQACEKLVSTGCRFSFHSVPSMRNFLFCNTRRFRSVRSLTKLLLPSSSLRWVLIRSSRDQESLQPFHPFCAGGVGTISGRLSLFSRSYPLLEILIHPAHYIHPARCLQKAILGKCSCQFFFNA
jgi:hypothetical protein